MTTGKEILKLINKPMNKSALKVYDKNFHKRKHYNILAFVLFAYNADRGIFK